jgi:cytochrome o ubiquinol oxidase subunit II
MKKSVKPVFYMLLFTGIILFLILLMQPLTIIKFYKDIDVLFPKGLIGIEQRDLLLVIQVLMLLVIIPVYILTFVFSWKYNSNNPKGKYDPDLVDNRIAEYIWWGIPLIMTLIVGAITWVKTYQLDPYKPIEAQWKWLFIYPKEKIASLNFMQFPKQIPLHFEITADAPMNSFWIPDLGGQIYAMPSMKTELNLIADDIGEFRGSSANISGVGFAGMNFIARASSEENYHQWIEEAKKSTKILNWETYEKLADPSQYNSPEIFQLQDEALFNQIIQKYMHPKG